jgi:hypothetical protein
MNHTVTLAFYTSIVHGQKLGYVTCRCKTGMVHHSTILVYHSIILETMEIDAPHLKHLSDDVRNRIWNSRYDVRGSLYLLGRERTRHYRVMLEKERIMEKYKKCQFFLEKGY